MIDINAELHSLMAMKLQANNGTVMARTLTKARAIAIELEPAEMVRAFLLVALLAIGLLASAFHARAEGAIVTPDVAKAACSVHVASAVAQNASSDGMYSGHGQTTHARCGASCCGTACHMSLGLAAAPILPIPPGVLRPFQMPESSGSVSLSPDAFRPPIA
ncbi:hypothetical protein [Mesorhizobium sp. M4B.F.Ca.ET.049.02.1.2]|uniref:hypothetical protein n=1 Tax=Mesorhizobium sp. M4B.F.Ca.ET.049.02.1.2 TaxID=2496752 RepID=UPI000FCBA83C|nr:hypothetical protein [Mesorhizobium sp. M4B.F.Ca.ET.049.02.1.2]RUW72126.1 hypothetical protein EOA31_16350 [Mesorhizobium sp. M4B.F.Ca.ET.049.02.1.2]